MNKRGDSRKFLTVALALGVGVGLMVATATPGFAQAYCACWGTGNVSYTPLLEKTNGAYGWAMSVPPQSGAAASAYAQGINGNSAYAYSPAVGGSSRHMKHNRRR
jgi:hypothetical protein